MCACFSLFLLRFPQLEGARASGGQPGVGVGPAAPSKQAEARGDQGPEEKPCRGGSGSSCCRRAWAGGEAATALYRPSEEPGVFCISNGLQRPLPGNAVFLLSQTLFPCNEWMWGLPR